MKTISERNEEAWKMLEEKGFTIQERMKIRKAFMDFGVDISESSKIKKDGINGEYFKNENVEGYLFSNEKEAIFVEHLFKFVPENADKDKVLEIMSIIIKLFDIKSDWAYRGCRH